MGLEYPKELPLEEVAFLWDRVRGKQVPPGKLFHAAWVVVGYALYQLGPVGSGSPFEGVQPIGEVPFEVTEAEPVLEGLVKGTTQAGPATWWMLLRLAIWVIGEGK